MLTIGDGGSTHVRRRSNAALAPASTLTSHSPRPAQRSYSTSTSYVSANVAEHRMLESTRATAKPKPKPKPDSGGIFGHIRRGVTELQATARRVGAKLDLDTAKPKPKPKPDSDGIFGHVRQGATELQATAKRVGAKLELDRVGSGNSRHPVKHQGSKRKLADFASANLAEHRMSLRSARPTQRNGGSLSTTNSSSLWKGITRFPKLVVRSALSSTLATAQHINRHSPRATLTASREGNRYAGSVTATTWKRFVTTSSRSVTNMFGMFGSGINTSKPVTRSASLSADRKCPDFRTGFEFPREGKSSTVYSRNLPGGVKIDVLKGQIKGVPDSSKPLVIPCEKVNKGAIPSYLSGEILTLSGPIPKTDNHWLSYLARQIGEPEGSVTVGSAEAGVYSDREKYKIALGANLVNLNGKVMLGGESGNEFLFGGGAGLGGSAELYHGKDSDGDGYREFGGNLGYKLAFGGNLGFRVEPGYVYDTGKDLVAEKIDTVKDKAGDVKDTVMSWVPSPSSPWWG
jgi:hypothetical protein